MDNELLKILNEELMELKKMTKLSEQRLDIQREELNKHTLLLNKHTLLLDKQTDLVNRHQAGFEILFRTMTKLEERLDLEIEKLKKQ